MSRVVDEQESRLITGMAPAPAPPTGVARTRLRRARPLVTVAQLIGPTLLVVLLWVDLATRHWAPAIVASLMWLICVWRWRRGRYRPWRWPRSALWMNTVTGVFIAGLLMDLLLSARYARPDPGWITAFIPFVVVVGMVAGVWGVWSLARFAERLVLEPFTIELADSPLEVAFPSRVDPKRVLLIAHDEISIDGNPSALLDEVGPVELFDHEAGDPWPHGGPEPSPGPFVRFDALGATWVFPTVHGAEIAEVIQRRRPIPAPPQPPRRIPSHQERSTVDGQKLTRSRHEADRRIADAVRALRDTPSFELPAARAALREMCDEAIAELIHGSDLLVPAGRLMMRRDAARIQRLRDHYCT